MICLLPISYVNLNTLLYKEVPPPYPYPGASILLYYQIQCQWSIQDEEKWGIREREGTKRWLANQKYGPMGRNSVISCNCNHLQTFINEKNRPFKSTLITNQFQHLKELKVLEMWSLQFHILNFVFDQVPWCF